MVTATLKTVDVAAVLKCSPDKVQRLVQAGLLNRVPNMSNRMWRFTEDEVRRFLNEKASV